MDLQAILNASDSSDDEYSSGAPPSYMSNYHFSPAHNTLSGSVHVDLEQILNEDDDSGDSNDLLDLKHSKMYRLSKPDTKSSPPAQGYNAAVKGRYTDHGTLEEINTSQIGDPRGKFNNQIDGDIAPLPSSYNPEDWAVLQAILHEDEDDDDLSDVDPSMSWIKATSSPTFSFHRNTYDDNHSNEELFRSANDDISDRKILENHEMAKDQYLHDRIIHTQGSAHSVTKTGLLEDGYIESKLDIKENSQTVFTSINQPAKIAPQPSGLLRHDIQQRTNLNQADDYNSTHNEDTSRKALEYAFNSERKLLKSGHREIVSPLMVKRRLKPRIELSSRASVQKNKNYVNKNQIKKNGMGRSRSGPVPVGSHFNFSGIVDNKVMSGVTKQITKHADPTHSKVFCGLPTCLAFNSKFIAVGTQNGIILIFDLFEVLRQRLGASTHDENWTGGKTVGSITSIDLSFNGEAVVAGYTTGVIVLWDTIRGVVLRSVFDSHFSPITSVRFLSDLKMVTVDAGGLVNKLTFSKNLLWSNYSVEPECLLDGTAGQILAMNVLPPYATVKPSMRQVAFSKVLSKLMLMALSSERSSFVVAVDPKVNVLHRWARPPTDRTDPITGSELFQSEKTYLPCLSWGWALISGGGNVALPILARAWGCCLQLLCASFPTFDEIETPNTGMEPIIHWPAFGAHDEIDALSPIVAIDWLNDRTLVYLTESNELTLVDTVMMTLLERLDFSGISLVYAEFSLSRSARKDNSSESATSSSMVFQNSTRCSDDRLLVLGQNELLCISIVGARRRISSLEADGEWLEALAFALDHYENTVVSQEDRKRDPNARKDLSRHPEFSAAKSDEEEWIAKLLMRYLNLAVENAPESSTVDALRPSGPGSVQRIDLAQSHYQMLCGVACEFCLSIRRIDLLFGPIFRRFQAVGYTNVFLDVLEPYVLNDKLSYIAPEVMSLFVEHCKTTNGIATVERCLLHMDCTIMDFDSILSLLRRNEMFTALFYVFNQGLDDYVSPLEILLEKVFDEADTGGMLLARQKDGVLRRDFERLGYKAIVYLQTCFKGKSFPQEKMLEPEERQQSLKVELLNFLIQRSFTPSAHIKKVTKIFPLIGLRSMPFPYIRLLLNLDPWCTLETITIALDTLDDLSQARSRSDSLCEWVDGSKTVANASERLLCKQTVIDVLSSILLPHHPAFCQSETMLLKSKDAINAFLDFACKYLMEGIVKTDKKTTFMILKRKSSLYSSAIHADGRKSAQQQIMSLLSALPRDSYDPDKVLEVFNNSNMHRASLLLHQQVASSWNDTGLEDIELRTRHFLSAIDCYLGDEDKMFRKEVFHYVNKECAGTSATGESQEGARQSTLRDALLVKLHTLVHLDSEMTARLVVDLFADELDQVMDALDSDDGGEGQYLLLQGIISGDLWHVDPVLGSVIHVSMEHHQKYLGLMAKLHPEMVYEYLSTHDNYRNDESLRLCQHYDIADASAYLLERMGNVSSALQLILQTLESRLMGLKRTVRSLNINSMRHHSGIQYGSSKTGTHSSKIVLPSKQEKDVEGVKRILIVALDVCERNSETSPTVEDGTKFSRGELWFNVLDRLINAKGFLRLSKEQPEHGKVIEVVLSDLLRLTMQRMVSNVPLRDLVRKVTSDHSGTRIGELREMVDSLLSTYGFELKVFQCAVSAFHYDVHDMHQQQFFLQVQGKPVQAVMNVQLGQNFPKNIENFSRQPLPVSTGNGGTLLIGSNSNASLLCDERIKYQQKADTGLVNALSRLRNRREMVDGKADTSHRFGDLNMMTITEQQYQENENDNIVYDRFSGVLGEAEHHGRLMMFH